MNTRMLIFSETASDVGAFMPEYPYKFQVGKDRFKSIQEYINSIKTIKIKKSNISTSISSIINIEVDRFLQSKTLQKVLLDTGKRMIFIVNDDPFWGVSYDSQTGEIAGKNMIGKIIMCIRDVLSDRK